MTGELDAFASSVRVIYYWLCLETLTGRKKDDVEQSKWWEEERNKSKVSGRYLPWQMRGSWLAQWPAKMLIKISPICRFLPNLYWNKHHRYYGDSLSSVCSASRSSVRNHITLLDASHFAASRLSMSTEHAVSLGQHCLTLNIKAIKHFETSQTTRQMTRRHIVSTAVVRGSLVSRCLANHDTGRGRM